MRRRRAPVSHAGASLAAVLAALALARPGIAAVPLPDLAPPRTERIALRWQDQPAIATMAPGAFSRGAIDDARFHEMTATIPALEHRFDLRAWRGRTVRIDFVMPSLVEGLASTTGLTVRWDDGVAFRSGRARPGDRVTVFVGRVDTDMLLERLRYTLVVDSRFFDGRIRFRPAFELEVK
ncbi:MAG: hypothetical protein AB7P21_01655 [Lautropia sp.]